MKDKKEERMGDILIIGYGTVGRNLEAELKTLQADIFDKYKKIKIHE